MHPSMHWAGGGVSAEGRGCLPGGGVYPGGVLLKPLYLVSESISVNEL